MKILMTTVAVAAMAFVPATAQAQLFGGLDNGTLLGGTVGAGLGGAIGSNLAGSGQRDEGTAIGAVVGGLAGAAYANSRSNYYGNPYAGQFNPGFNTRNLVGAGIGAGLGGVIGSNLAGPGQRQEGTAIGAVLGGVAGYALSNRGSSRYGNYGQQGGYLSGPAGNGYVGGGLPYGGYSYGGQEFSIRSAFISSPAFGAPGFPAAPIMHGPQFVPSGQYISGPILPVTRFVQPAPRPMILSQPRTVFTAPVSQGFTYAAPNVRLAAPPIRPTVVRRSYSVEPAPIIRAQRIIAEPANCPAGTTLQNDGTCLERTVSYTAPIISAPYVAPQMAECPAGTTAQSDGTCLKKSYSTSSYSGSSSVTLPDTTVYGGSSYSSSSLAGGYTSSAQMAGCTTGATEQSDGTCLSTSETRYTPSYSASPVTTTYRAPKVHKSHKKMHHKSHKAKRTQGEYCYAGGTKRYDSLGNLIKKDSHDKCRHD